MMLDLSTDFAIGAAICGGLSSIYLISIRLSPPEKITNIKKVQEFGYSRSASTGSARSYQGDDDDDVEWTRHAKASILPINMCIVIPTLLHVYRGGSEALSPSDPMTRLTVVINGIVGVTLFIWTNLMFHRAGGTLAPWDPPLEFVVFGPYLYTRNPMMTGILLIITAEGILLGNVAILGFSMSFFVFNTIYFIKKEEPQMKERFADYEDYYDAVPRWIPRLTPYKQKE